MYISESTLNVIKITLILSGAFCVCFIDLIIIEFAKFLTKLINKGDKNE